jgi:hypothetical protein
MVGEVKLIRIESDQRPEKRPLLAAYDAPRAASLTGIPRATRRYPGLRTQNNKGTYAL